MHSVLSGSWSPGVLLWQNGTVLVIQFVLHKASKETSYLSPIPLTLLLWGDLPRAVPAEGREFISGWFPRTDKLK